MRHRHRRLRKYERKRRTCTGKRRYGSELVAMREGARFGMDWYRCPYCGGWHLTSKNSQPEVRARKEGQ